MSVTERGIAAAEAAAARVDGDRRIRVLTPIGVGAVATAVGWLRLPAVARSTVWAEDGQFFLGAQLHTGTLGSLFMPYQGYLQLLPRLMAAAAVHVAPIERYAVVMAALSIVVVGVVAGAVWVLAADAVSNPGIRFLVALVPVLAPEAPAEILGNAANIHSFCLVLALWAFLARPRSWRGSAVLALVVLVIGLTEIQAVLFAPLLLAGLRDRRRWPIVASAGAALAAQAVTAVLFPRSAPRTPTVPVHDIVVGYLVEPLSQAFTWRSDVVGELYGHHRAAPFVVLLLVVLGVVVAGFLTARPRTRLVVLAATLASTATWGGAVLLNHGHQFRYAEQTPGQLLDLGTSRYAAVSSVFLLTALLVAADALLGGPRRSTRGPGRRRLVGAVAVIGVVVAIVLASPSPHTTRDHGPIWALTVERAGAYCRAHPSTTDVRIITAPHPPWNVDVPCGMIVRAR